ncbi:acyl-CoA synthetase (AMP-forming)/AMP-acid ligase II [Mycobacterium sp. BK086]|uniref:AMP-binding protein n=1 Tax=Mycobacterium sp. BK086 TaxID=2512165 RepID=UPI0010614834|nr:AMP-binding protein [Mycobacterium sp. BK086]TDO09152.1 acyl-CoA synthetase (AMP-forming)/AMP-acid ligase II [Mycobacterium sp. BK086]
MTGVAWMDGPTASVDRDGPDLDFTPVDLVNDPERGLLPLIAERLRHDPSALAVDDGTRRLTRADLLGEIAALAAVIAASVPAGAPVGVRLPDCASTPVAWLACLAAGCPAILLDPADAPERFARIATASRLAAVISDQPAAGHDVIAPNGHPPAPWQPRAMAVGAPAFVVWTSGSTGAPKGIVQSQRSVTFRSGLLINSGHLSAADRYLSLNTSSSMGGLLNAIASFVSGACLHRVDIAEQGLTGVLDRIEQSEITAMIAVPALYRALSRIDGAAKQLASLRTVSSNGEALLTADLELLRDVLPDGCAIQMIYGATETQAGMRFVPAAEVPQEAQVPAGRPIPGVEWVIVGEDGTPAPAGQVGELWIRSRYTAIGEWEDGTCVPGRLHADGVDGARRYAMGDLVRLREDGVFVVVGRIDRQMKLDGYRVEPVEVEAVLRAQPDVLDAAVLPMSHGAVTRLIAFVAVGAASPDGLTGRLRKALAAALPPAMRPQRIHVLSELPLLPGNKIDPEKLRLIDAGSRRR